MQKFVREMQGKTILYPTGCTPIKAPVNRDLKDSWVPVQRTTVETTLGAPCSILDFGRRTTRKWAKLSVTRGHGGRTSTMLELPTLRKSWHKV
eukprot:1323184-Rhodomonas_salina.3